MRICDAASHVGTTRRSRRGRSDRTPAASAVVRGVPREAGGVARDPVGRRRRWRCPSPRRCSGIISPRGFATPSRRSEPTGRLRSVAGRRGAQCRGGLGRCGSAVWRPSCSPSVILTRGSVSDTPVPPGHVPCRRGVAGRGAGPGRRYSRSRWSRTLSPTSTGTRPWKPGLTSQLGYRRRCHHAARRRRAARAGISCCEWSRKTCRVKWKVQS